jgi:EAL domain-containing protein (putative c-di-GMP-specific phosphodiesterase class I)
LPPDSLASAHASSAAVKESGGNRVHIYHPDDQGLIQRHVAMQWTSRIVDALEHNRFQLYYQPILPLITPPNQGERFEILLRLIDQSGQIITPRDFIASAERYNLMSRVDRWVIHAFCSVYHELYGKKTTRELSLCSINLSGTSISEENFLDFIYQELDKYQIPPEKICFEITETAAIANLNRAVKFMEVLKTIGCKFALDDFGSGLSAFSYLKDLPVDFLKIDGVFVSNILKEPNSMAIVEAINHISHIMGIRTIAEYAEAEEITAKLKDIKVDYMQGFYIGVPKLFYDFSPK